DAALDRLGRVEDREAVLARLAVREDRVLHGRRGLAGSRDEGDLVDLLEALQAGTGARATVLADPERVTTAAAGRRRGRGRLLAVALAGRRRRRALGRADVDDEAARAAVVEEAVDAVRERLRALLEVTEGLHELR